MPKIPNPLPLLSDESKHSHNKKKCDNCTGNGSCASIDDRSDSLLTPEENVLPTLNSDGSRIWIIPSLAKGVLWKRRRWLAYALIAFFVTLPHLRIRGKPYVLIDIASRQFTFFGHTFYPTDTPLVACLMLAVFFSIMLVTTLAGRVWCGWGCPQTVYLEFLFRPIDRERGIELDRRVRHDLEQTDRAHRRFDRGLEVGLLSRQRDHEQRIDMVARRRRRHL